MNFKIRKAKYNDLSRIIRINEKCFKGIRDLEWCYDSNLLRSHLHETFIAVENNKILGLVTVEDCEIILLAVEKQYRKNGIGRTLMQKAIEYIRSYDYEEAVVGTLNTLRTIPFYKKIGFEVINTGKYSDGVKYTDLSLKIA